MKRSLETRMNRVQVLVEHVRLLKSMGAVFKEALDLSILIDPFKCNYSISVTQSQRGDSGH